MVMRLITIILLITILAIEDSTLSASMVGGWSTEKPVTQGVVNIALSVENSVKELWKEICNCEDHSDCCLNEFIPKSYKSQVVAGTNYIIKIKVQTNKYIVIKVFKPLPYLQADPQLQQVVPYESGEINVGLFV